MTKKLIFFLISIVFLFSLVLFSCEKKQKKSQEEEQYINMKIIELMIEIELSRQREKMEEQTSNMFSIFPDYFMDAINIFVLEIEDESIRQVIIRFNQEQYPGYLMEAINMFVLEILGNEIVKEKRNKYPNIHTDYFTDFIKRRIIEEMNNTVFSKLFPELKIKVNE